MATFQSDLACLNNNKFLLLTLYILFHAIVRLEILGAANLHYACGLIVTKSS